MATIHRYHPDIKKGDDSNAILFDECERCSQHSIALWDLDGSMVEKLWRRMLVVEIYNTDNYHSLTEKAACLNLWQFYLILERFTNIDPRKLFEPIYRRTV